MTQEKHLQWLNRQMQEWLNQGLADPETVARLQAHYRLKARETKRLPALSFALVILGTLLVLLGVILILAKNWSALPRLARVFISLIPLLAGIGLGIFTLLGDKGRLWKEVSGLVVSIGLLTAMAMTGQVYHVISDPSHLFLGTALLSLPLVYLFSADLTALVYLILISIYFGVAAAQRSLSFGGLLLAGVLLGGALKPWLLMQIHQKKLQGHDLWLNLALGLTGFVWFMAMLPYWIPWQEFLYLYFLLLILGDAFLYSDAADTLPGNWPLSREDSEHHTLSLLGKLALYFLFYIFTFRDLWLYQAQSSFRPITYGVLLVLFALAAGFTFFLYRQSKFQQPDLMEAAADGGMTALKWALPLLPPVLILIFQKMPDRDAASLLAVICFNLVFFGIGLRLLLRGISQNRLGTANLGLFFLVLIIGTRFLDIDFSFLVRGLVFVALGLGFLFTNLWMVRKSREKAEEPPEAPAASDAPKGGAAQ